MLALSACGREDCAVVIVEVDADSKIRAIKAIREETGLGLAEAKRIAETLPATVRDGLTPDEAVALMKRLEESGMRVEIRRR